MIQKRRVKERERRSNNPSLSFYYFPILTKKTNDRSTFQTYVYTVGVKINQPPYIYFLLFLYLKNYVS